MTKVIKGGSFDFDRDYTRCALRIRITPGFRYYDVGFRCARTDDKTDKTIKGGSFISCRDFTRCAYRIYNTPGYRYDEVGFRCTKTKNIKGENQMKVKLTKKQLQNLTEVNDSMVTIPAGNYKSANGDKFIDEFSIDKYQVTNKRFTEFLNSVNLDNETLNKYINLEKAHIYQKNGKFYAEKGWKNHPVVYVSWYGADAYARHHNKRLPTEAEWEKAAGGVEGLKWPWGNEFQEDRVNTYESGIGKTVSVKKFPKGDSPFGARQMAGNTWEWTGSDYD
jgi:formylglycine-generating enzyme required for sulfatase activity